MTLLGFIVGLILGFLLGIFVTLGAIADGVQSPPFGKAPKPRESRVKDYGIR